MAQISKYPISKSVYERIFDLMLQTFSKFNTKKEVSDFIAEFLTPTERIMLSKRLAISLLLAKNYSYEEISQTLKVSKGTIGSVSSQYKYGSSLRNIINQLLKTEGIEDFWLEIADMFTSIGSIGSKGTKGWRYLNAEIKKKRLNKPF